MQCSITLSVMFVRFRVLLALSALGVVSGLLPGRAWAVDGLTYASALSPDNSDPTRTVSVVCPEGTLAIGGGAIISGSNKVAITSAFPIGQIFRLVATEPAEGESSSWYMVALAMCAPNTSIRELNRREFISRTNADSLSVPCVGDQALIGMGGEILSQSAGAALTSIDASTDLRTLTVRGGATGITSWSLRGVALCADRVPGQQLVVSTSAMNYNDRKSARASCPRGTKIHSVGFDFSARSGQLYVTKLVPRIDLFGSGSLEGVDVDGLETAPGFVAAGHDALWWLRAQALCAN